jgi:hypothetical protein
MVRRVVPLLIVLALLVVVVSYTGALRTEPAGSGPRAAAAGSLQNTTVTCGVFGPHPGTAPGPPAQDVANVTVIWDALCGNATFMALLSEWSGLSVAYPDSGANASYLAADNLTAGGGGNLSTPYAPAWWLDWWAPCNNIAVAPAGTYCDHSAVWIGNVTTDRFSGPVESDHLPGPVIGTSPPSPRGSSGTAVLSGGLELLVVGAALGTVVGLLTLLLARRK